MRDRIGAPSTSYLCASGKSVADLQVDSVREAFALQYWVSQ